MTCIPIEASMIATRRPSGRVPGSGGRAAERRHHSSQAIVAATIAKAATRVMRMTSWTVTSVGSSAAAGPVPAVLAC